MSDKRSPRLIIAAIVLLGVIGIGWDILTAAILFLHSYSFFESIVVCLLVMILCGVATVRADVELGVFPRMSRTAMPPSAKCLSCSLASDCMSSSSSMQLRFSWPWSSWY